MTLPSFLPLLAELMLKSSVVLLLALLVSRCGRRASAANRHMIWLATFGGLLVLPFTMSLFPGDAGTKTEADTMLVLKIEVDDVALNAVEQASSPSLPVGALPPSRPWQWPGWREVVVFIWLAVSLALLGWRALGALHLRMVRQRSALLNDSRIQTVTCRIATEYRITRKIELRLSGFCPGAMTWGTWRPVVMLTSEAQEWTDERLERVLRHELAHVARKDCFVRLVSQLVCAVYWPNPLVWFAARRLRLTQEQACDDRVLAAGAEAEEYANDLVASAGSMPGFGLEVVTVAMAEPSTLETRIIRIFSAGSDRSTLRSSTVGMAIVMSVAVFAVCLSLQVRGGEKQLGAIKDPSQVLAEGEKVSVEIESHVFEIKNNDPDAKIFLSTLEGAVSKEKSSDTVLGTLTPEQTSYMVGRLKDMTKDSLDSFYRLKKSTSPRLSDLIGLSERNLSVPEHKSLAKGHAAEMPRITTMANREAKLAVGQELLYPTRWRVEGNSYVASDFQKNDTGMVVRLLPQVNGGKTIELKLSSELNVMKGFLEAPNPSIPFEEGRELVVKAKADGSLLMVATSDSASSVIRSPHDPATEQQSLFLPIFSRRSAEATVSHIISGHTVVMRCGPSRYLAGNTLLNEVTPPDNDTTLLIFVTAKMLSPEEVRSKEMIINRKLDLIIIDEVSFENLPFSVAIGMLQKLSITNDHTKLSANPGVDLVFGGGAPTNQSVNAITLRNLSLRRMLEIVCESVGYEISVTEDRVLIKPSAKHAPGGKNTKILPE